MTEQFDEEYVLELFNLALKDVKYLETIAQHLKYTMLPDEESKSLWKGILTTHKLSKNKLTAPTIGVLKMHFRTEIKVLNLLSDIRELNVPDPDQILGSLTDFIKQHKFVEIYDNVYSLYSKDKDKAYELFIKQAEEFNQINLTNAKHDRIFKDYDARNTKRQLDKLEAKKDRLPTPILEVNHYTHGGGEQGEIWMYLGQSGAGKSFCLLQHGIHLARRGYKVLHIQAEGTRKQALDRFDSCWMGSTYYDVKDFEIDPEKLARCKRALRKIGDGEVFVETMEKFGTKTIADVRQSVIDLKKEHPELTCLVLDYFELFDPGDGKSYSTDVMGEKARQQAIGRLLKDLAVEQNLWIITATQGGGGLDINDLNDPNFVQTRANLGNDKDKIRPFDVFITINRTKDEVKRNIARLHIDKAREHAGNITVQIYQNLKHSRFYDAKKTLAHFFDPAKVGQNDDDDEEVDERLPKAKKGRNNLKALEAEADLATAKRAQTKITTSTGKAKAAA